MISLVVATVLLFIHALVCLVLWTLMKLGLLPVRGHMPAVMVLVPLWGPLLVVLLSVRSAVFGDGLKDATLETLRINDDMHRSMLVQGREGDGGVVPLEEALIVNDPGDRRRLMLSMLTEDPDAYLAQLQAAKLNDDVEVAHYAATAVVQISKESDLKLQQLERAFKTDPSSHNLDAYCDFLGTYLDSGLAEGRVAQIQHQQYARLLARRCEREDGPALRIRYATALADAGEASLVYCDDCGFAADDEAASTKVVVTEGPGDGTLTKVETPGMGTIEAVAKFFGFPENGTRKSLALIDAEGKPVVAIVPGDHELNDCKAEHVFGKGYRMMTDEELQAYGLHKGFIGPVNLPEGIRLVCDESLRESKQWACGANEVDYHFTGACPERDFSVDEWADLVTVVAGDPCPHCGKPLSAARGIEVSQVFQLGTKYSEAMGATFMDEDGKEKPLIMGCYGVGVSRSLAAVVEQHNDEHGIVWPVSVAPYEVAVIPLDPKKEECATVCNQIVEGLCAEGIEVVVDDRDERPGFKFADNDLMGFPYQVVLGKRGLKNGTVELKDRATGEREDVAIDEVVAKVAELVKAARR